MTNKDMASLFHEMANLMELHGENEFKTRTYANAYLNIRKLDIPLGDKSLQELKSMVGIASSIADKIIEIHSKNTFEALETFREKTPAGIREILNIKGLGPKKVKQLWHELNIESPGELQYACQENRLIQLKGFGLKIQADILNSLLYYQSNQHLFLSHQLKATCENICKKIEELNTGLELTITGGIRRMNSIVDKIEYISNHPIKVLPEAFNVSNQNDLLIEGVWDNRIPVIIHITNPNPNQWPSILFTTTDGSESFLSLTKEAKNLTSPNSEAEIFKALNMSFIPPECRDLDHFDGFDETLLITNQDIRGVIHNHSTYSDGIYSVKDMALECIRLGYNYLVISDHSKSAGYANGLPMERVEMQWREIDTLNKELAPFHIYKSIESDILADGSLDYDDDFLKGFDLIIASIHSNLKMDESKAMMRLIKAIENPHTRILGHPTGRLLLSRPGYPIDHYKIIDACAANQVCIELNANPLRLDLDWSWIPYAQNKGVLISINPDAHNLLGIQDIQYGVNAARKGGLKKINCLNIKTLSEFNTWITSKS